MRRGRRRPSEPDPGKPDPAASSHQRGIPATRDVAHRPPLTQPPSARFHDPGIFGANPSPGIPGSWTGRRFGALRHGNPAGHIRFGEAGPAAGAVAGSAETSGAALPLRTHPTWPAAAPGHPLTPLPTAPPPAALTHT